MSLSVLERPFVVCCVGRPCHVYVKFQVTVRKLPRGRALLADEAKLVKCIASCRGYSTPKAVMKIKNPVMTILNTCPRV